MCRQGRTTQPTRADVADVNFEFEGAWYFGVPGAHTCLHIAVICGRTEVASSLLDAGADSLHPTSSGQTPLHLAVSADSCNETLRVHSRSNSITLMSQRCFFGAAPI